MKANPYLNFDGNCRESMEFYKSVFLAIGRSASGGGGLEFDNVMTFGEMPRSDDFETPEEEKGRILHMSLPIGEDLWILASDILPSQGHKLTIGNNNYICLVPQSKDEGEDLFKKLSEGGEVEMPYDKQFWGDYFASFKDKFGVGWMVNWSEKK